MILQASLDSWLSLASTVFAAVAAVATIVAVMYARKTVNDSPARARCVVHSDPHAPERTAN
jgi:hypothetical protein